jgi:hypothetical protein
MLRKNLNKIEYIEIKFFFKKTNKDAFFLHRVGFFFRVSIEPEILTVHVAKQRNLKNMNLSMYA